MDKEQIAMVCHEANRTYCVGLGDFSQLPWYEATEATRISARMGVDLHCSGDFGPEASHEAWMRHKLAEGWEYGTVKNEEAKTHPCMVAFRMLPPTQQAKDHLFRGIVHALRGFLDDK